MEKTLRTIKDRDGHAMRDRVLIQEDGMLFLFEVSCHRSRLFNLGNCKCVNHPSATVTPVSTGEVIRRFGAEALDGFEEPGREQIIFNAFGVEAAVLEKVLRIAYSFGVNPLPTFRTLFGNRIVFGEDLDSIVFPEEEPGKVIFIVNSRGEISVREV